MPLDKAYDKMIDSKNADIKNIGGRWARLVHGGGLPQRFVKDTPWAHIDIAGTAMDAPAVGDQPELGFGLGRPAARSLRGGKIREGVSLKRAGNRPSAGALFLDEMDTPQIAAGLMG